MLETNVESPPTKGKVARAIEQKTQRIPSDLFLWAALGFIGISAAMQIRNNRREGSLLIAQLAPTFLLLGLYNKLVKVAGSDRFEQEPSFIG